MKKIFIYIKNILLLEFRTIGFVVKFILSTLSPILLKFLPNAWGIDNTHIILLIFNIILAYILCIIANRAQKLENPEITISYEEEGCKILTSDFAGPSIFLRLKIKNDSSELLKNIAINLIGIKIDQQQVPYGEVTKLTWASTDLSVTNIQPQAYNYVDLIETYSGGGRILGKYPNSVHSHHSLNGTALYEFKIQVCSDNTRAFEKIITFNWTGNWETAEIVSIE